MRGPGEAAPRNSHPVFCLCENEKHRAQPQPGWKSRAYRKSETRILDDMLGKSQAPCALPIGQAFRHAANYILFPPERTGSPADSTSRIGSDSRKAAITSVSSAL